MDSFLYVIYFGRSILAKCFQNLRIHSNHTPAAVHAVPPPKGHCHCFMVPGGQRGFVWWEPPLGRLPAPEVPRCCSAPLPRARSGCCPVWCGTPLQSTGGSRGWWCDRCVSSPAPPVCQVLGPKKKWSEDNFIETMQWTSKCIQASDNLTTASKSVLPRNERGNGNKPQEIV